MKTKLALAAILLATGLATSATAGPRVAIGINFGPGYYPAPPPPRYVAMPRCPGPGYIWTDGYWHPGRDRYLWQPGAWVRPPYARARWIAPRVHRGHYHRGYWR
jgi:hypothetical protein